VPKNARLFKVRTLLSHLSPAAAGRAGIAGADNMTALQCHRSDIA
jgi:hypothetical protein